MQKQPVGRSLFLLAVLAVAGSSARADTLYAVLGDQLAVIDTDAVSGSVIGATGFDAVGGLARDNGGTLYAVSAFVLGDELLLTVDPDTGSAGVVGIIDAPMTFSTGLASDPTTDTLFGISQDGAGFSSFLVTVSKADASTAPIGDTSADAVVGLDFDAVGTLWGIDGGPGNEELVRIDKTSGATTVVGPNGLIGLPNIGGFAIGASGEFWSVHHTGIGDYELVNIDPDDGSPTIVGTIAGFEDEVGGVTGLVSAQQPECFLVIGDGAGDARFLALDHLFQTQLDGIEGFHAVLMDAIPEFELPALGREVGAAMETVGPGGAVVDKPSATPEWMLDGEFTVQVLMWNPQVFPGLPEQSSAGLHVQLLPGGQVATWSFGEAVGGIDVWAEVETLRNGKKVIRFSFTVDGM